MNFRPRIKEILSQQGLTQKELASKLGISDIALNQSLRGEYPQLQTLERIANALGVRITDLFEAPSPAVSNAIVCPKCGARIHLHPTADQ